eukprot:TRINITY_DN1443_c0_g2_i1.p1 TRINITY_DN1443_c0_g2~~TRINITY_DN1443_c0_g2_i1.p1  ORF type:complete len:570 (-),score=131.69 TRINITY_DN1443_c0_g2_i1:441-2150(-)
MEYAHPATDTYDGFSYPSPYIEHSVIFSLPTPGWQTLPQDDPPILMVSVPEHRKCWDATNKAYIAYVISVTTSTDQTWQLHHRYSTLLDFHENLKDEFPKEKFPSFPSKGYIFNSMEPEYIEARRVHLEKYLQGILGNEKLRTSATVKRFLFTRTIPEASIPRSKSHYGSVYPGMTWKEDVAAMSRQQPVYVQPVQPVFVPQAPDNSTKRQVLLFPLPPPNIVIPAMVSLHSSGENCFLESLLQHIREATQFFQKLRDDLEACKDIERKFELLHESNSRVTVEIFTLNEEKTQINHVLEDLLMRYDDKLCQYLRKVQNHIDYLTAISSSLDAIVLEHMESPKNPAPQFGKSPLLTRNAVTPAKDNETEQIQMRVSLYEQRAQELVIAFAGASGDEKKKLKQSVVELSKEVEQDLLRCSDTALLRRLRNVTDFITANAVSLKRSPSEKVADLERGMYALIERATEYDRGEDYSAEAASEIRESILEMMKKMALRKASLRKQELDKVPDRDHLCDRIEDLQENLADFEHNFSMKNFFNRGIGEKAKDMYKSKQLEDAQREHARVSDEMFGL